MKEITFEELINEKENLNVPNFIHFNDVLELLQQVREATKAECHLIADRYYFQNSENIIRDINKLPTDRIKTEK